MPEPLDPIARDLYLALKVHMTAGQRKKLGLTNRLTGDEDAAALAQRLADQLRLCGWRFDRCPIRARWHSTP